MDPDTVPSKEPTRRELYDRVWATPATKLAAELGISDVAFAKRCKKLDIPRPSRGYWAKLAAGQSPRKEPLPPGEEEKLLGQDPVSNRIDFPDSSRNLHSAARDLLAALRAAKPDDDDLVKAKGPAFPEVEVSKALVEHAARCLSTIIVSAERRGVSFKGTRRSYRAAFFERSREQLYLTISEKVVTLKKEPTERDKRRPPWEWQTSVREASKRLTFSIGTDEYRRGRVDKSWSESAEKSTEETLREVVDGICEHYAERDRERVREEVRRHEQAETWKKQQEEERKRKHLESIQTAAQQRAADLILAAEWWRIYRNACDFIEACETRWRTSQGGNLTGEQGSWIQWAHEHAQALSPFELGYPDPLKDGQFDTESISFGGPYPQTRKLPKPPTMPEIPPPAAQPGSSWAQVSEHKPYPFWLKY